MAQAQSDHPGLYSPRPRLLFLAFRRNAPEDGGNLTELSSRTVSEELRRRTAESWRKIEKRL